jgi:hypothetical protein
MDTAMQSALDAIARASEKLIETQFDAFDSARVLELNNDLRLATIDFNNLLMERERAPHVDACLAILASEN